MKVDVFGGFIRMIKEKKIKEEEKDTKVEDDFDFFQEAIKRHEEFSQMVDSILNADVNRKKSVSPSLQDFTKEFEQKSRKGYDTSIDNIRRFALNSEFTREIREQGIDNQSFDGIESRKPSGLKK